MPRLTNTDYLQLHHSLRSLWFNRRGAFGLISSQQQRALHRYFLLAKDVTDAELLQHRRDVSMRWPNLPHRARRAVAQLRRIADAVSNGSTATEGRSRRIVIHAVLRPEPNLTQLIAALATVPSNVDGGCRKRTAQ